VRACFMHCGRRLLNAPGECHAEGMRQVLMRAAALLLFTSTVFCAAQEKGYWRAASSNAASITGDIEISPTKLSINFSGFTIAHIRELSAAETGAIFASEPSGAAGNLYRLNIPATKRFLRHNSLCGSDDVQWMVTSVSEKTLYVAFLSGANAPNFTPEAMANSTDLCGTFTYVR
jgi:hypothetical protein